ncbi:HD-GYP domain-containing protein [Geobacillus zalihae]|uniref:HD-GYP domain-containing protein n=1 Tax=Geobacillus zalihae TaxID=213419 RepID=UPI0009BFD374|nr:HD-GYP domain-containing protein [Geobacillus zalihae]OQP15866.1 phosphohydrolase [Geobacillus zalihae]QNU23656.1 HD-GYP domain-containing protein [Geobacillus zalihae]
MVRVKRSQLREGCVLAEDVLGKTKRPIIPKNTVITKPLLLVLEKFLVEEVDVEPLLANGEPFPNVDSASTAAAKQPMAFYLEAVQRYKTWFQSWQAGLPVDIGEIRGVIISLFERMAGQKRELLMLHHYATKDEYLHHHAVSVGLLAGFLAMQLGYSEGECHQIALAGVLADCGMAKVSKRILTNPSALTEAEFNEVKQHPVFSYRMVQKIPALNHGAKLAVLQHHERNDGSGYPFGVKAERIHPYSQIVAVADVYHAMTSERLYRRKQSPFRAIETMQREQFGKLSTEAVAALVNNLIGLQTGAVVKLSNGEMAEVMFIPSDEPARPIVKIIETGQLLSLSVQRDIYIEEMVQG